MRDKRLDILLEHCLFNQVKDCRYFVVVQDDDSCTKMMKDGVPESVGCCGDIVLCELEDE